jgi:hypothetical protein
MMYYTAIHLRILFPCSFTYKKLFTMLNKLYLSSKQLWLCSDMCMHFFWEGTKPLMEFSLLENRRKIFDMKKQGCRGEHKRKKVIKLFWVDEFSSASWLFVLSFENYSFFFVKVSFWIFYGSYKNVNKRVLKLNCHAGYFYPWSFKIFTLKYYVLKLLGR